MTSTGSLLPPLCGVEMDTRWTTRLFRFQVTRLMQAHVYPRQLLNLQPGWLKHLGGGSARYLRDSPAA